MDDITMSELVILRLIQGDTHRMKKLAMPVELIRKAKWKEGVL